MRVSVETMKYLSSRFGIPFLLAAHVTSMAEQPATFNRDVVPILQEKCQECHRPGQIAPMSLVTYKETRPWARAIRKEVVSKRMPPFYAAGPIGHWKDDLRLLESEIRTFVRWVDQGTVRGDPKDLPQPRSWPDSEWPFGDPDVVVEFPTHRIKTTDSDVNVNLFSDYAFPEDTWLNAVTFKPVFNDTVHHAHIFVIPPGVEIPKEKKSRERLEGLMAYQAIYTWFPGLTVKQLPDDQGILIPKGSSFALVAHFAPRSNTRDEKVRLGVYRSTGTIKRRPSSTGTIMNDFLIPPNDPNYTRRKMIPITQDGWITHFRVHMHYRGKSCEYRLHYPDGRVETVFELPQYSFDWQRFYYLAEPIRVPGGTEVEIIATWDNSEDNPINPDPSRAVRWGPRTIDEMFGGTIYYTPVAELAQPVKVVDGRPVSAASD